MNTGRSSSSPDRLEVVLDALVEPALLTDASGVVTFANAVAIQQLGADKEIGVSLAEQIARSDLRVPDGTPLTWDEHPVRRALVTGRPVTGAGLLIRAAGGEQSTWVVNTAPLRSGDRITGTVSVFHDLTRWAQLETELADHGERLEAMVNLVSDVVFVIDADSRITFVNANGEALLGLEAGLSMAERHRRLDVHDASGRPLPMEEALSVRALRGETTSGRPLLVRDPAGHLRNVVTNAHPLRRPDGVIYAALVTMKDVTDEVRSRHELEAAREAAEEANHLKDQFIAALSHELRTPLQPILGWTEVLRRHGNLDAITTQAIEAIRRNIRQQVRLVDDLLDLSRIVHGKLALRYETFDLREAVRAAAEPFEEAAALKRLRLTLSIPPEPVFMWGDGTRLQQIATNLISNAVKFTAPGGTVTVHLIAGANDALLEVEDSGEGIAPDDLAVIFEAFRQAGGSRRRGGLGLGLDLVRRLTELHGGTVEAFSDGPGYGARFSVRVPLGRPQPLIEGPKPQPSRRLDGRQILIIEDNADTREVMRFMLETEGAVVDTAGTGEEGFERALAMRPELVLCDIGLPDVDGLEVARRLRRRGPEAMRLIALSGYGQPEDVQHAIDAGFEAHLTKPINIDELLSLLTGR
jgi:signal transduction histidine kinase/CheY-like chemotaxis protein